MSWEIVELKDIAAKTKYPIGDGDHGAIKPSEYLDNGVPYIRVADMNWTGEISEEKMVYISEELNNLNPKSHLFPGDIIISKTGATIGKVAIIPKKFKISNTTASIGKITINREIANERFVFWAMKTPDFQKEMWKVSHKSAQPGFNVDDLKRFKIPLPPLATQKRIAEILDAADALKRKDQELLKKYDELAQAIFIDMFGDPVKNEKGWEVGKIRDLALEVKYGTSKPAEDKGSLPYLRMNNITYSGKWDFTNLKFINLNNDEYEKYTLKKGDLIFNRTNSKELVGKTAVFDIDREMAIAGYLIRLRTNSKGNSYYISSYLNSKHGKKTLEGMCKSIVGMANINAQELQEIKILIPPIELQNKFEDLINQLNKIISKIDEQILESNSLFQTLLQKAFNGELVN